MSIPDSSSVHLSTKLKNGLRIALNFCSIHLLDELKFWRYYPLVSTCKHSIAFLILWYPRYVTELLYTYPVHVYGSCAVLLNNIKYSIHYTHTQFITHSCTLYSSSTGAIVFWMIAIWDKCSQMLHRSLAAPLHL